MRAIRPWPFVLLALCLLIQAPSAFAQCDGLWLQGDGIPRRQRRASLHDPLGPDGRWGVGARRRCARRPRRGCAGRRTGGLEPRHRRVVRALEPCRRRVGLYGRDWRLFTCRTAPAATSSPPAPLPPPSACPPATSPAWNGVAWSPLGSGANGTINALAVMPNGDVIAAGIFTSAGGVPANHIARWNGTAWSALGEGLSFSVDTIHALAVMPNGDLFAGGSINMVGETFTRGVARWDGTAWSPVGGGVDGNSGIVYAAGSQPERRVDRRWRLHERRRRAREQCRPLERRGVVCLWHRPERRRLHDHASRRGPGGDWRQGASLHRPRGNLERDFLGRGWALGV